MFQDRDRPPGIQANSEITDLEKAASRLCVVVRFLAKQLVELANESVLIQRTIGVDIDHWPAPDRRGASGEVGEFLGIAGCWMAGMALAGSCAIALGANLGRRMAPDFNDRCRLRSDEMTFEQIKRYEFMPSVDDGTESVGKGGNGGEDGLVAGAAEFAAVVAVANAQVVEEGFLDGIDGKNRQRQSARDRRGDGGLAAGRHTIDEKYGMHDGLLQKRAG
jgi:hypothetical protein